MMPLYVIENNNNNSVAALINSKGIQINGKGGQNEPQIFWFSNQKRSQPVKMVFDLTKLAFTSKKVHYIACCFI